MIRKLCLLMPLTLFAYEGYIPPAPNRPWLTGTLLTASGNITPIGHWNIEPYLFATTTSSYYGNDWNIHSEDRLTILQWRLPVFVGLNQWMDIKFTPVWNWKHRDGAGHWSLGDMTVQFDFQLYRDPFPPKGWLPSIRLAIRESIPVGKYRNLDPNSLGTDAGGFGSWLTTLAFNTSKLIKCYEKHYLNVLFNLQYGVPSPIHIKGINVYGGGMGTNGTLYPERIFQANLAFEYTISKNWAFALDAVALVQSKTRFSGNPGIQPNSSEASISPFGLPAANERSAMIQYSLAPAIEYNWSRNLGLIGGCWFTVAGKNSARFASGVLALNYSQ